MKKSLYILFASVLLTAGVSYAVTNVAKVSGTIDSRSLPADSFRPTVNDRLYDVVNTDLTGIVAAVNELLQPQSDTNATLS